jgi:hypothetical protein
MLFPYLVKVSLLLAILTLGYRWLVQFETFSRVNRMLLLFNIAAAWTLPLLPLPYWGPVKVQQQFHETVPVLSEKLPRITEANVFTGPLELSTLIPATSTVHETQPIDILFTSYMAGVLVLTSLLLVRILALIRRLQKLPKQTNNGFTLIYDRGLTAPYSFFKWIVLDPTAYSQQELEHILAHEAEHARNWHSVDLLLVEIQKTALWFNPFAYYHSKLVQENLEFLADKAVLRVGFDKKPYQLNLLKIAQYNPHLPLTNSFAQSILKKRIKMMNRKPSQLWVISKYTLLITVIYISSAFVAPYKHQLIQLAPAAIKPTVEALVVDNSQPKDEHMEEIKKRKNIKDNVLEIVREVIPFQASLPENNWIIKRNDTLFWAISPLANWDNIVQVREGIKSMGGEFNIDEIKFNNRFKFISKLNFTIKSEAETTQYYMFHRDSALVNKPIDGLLGIATPKKVTLSQSHVDLAKRIEKDNNKALNLFMTFSAVEGIMEDLKEKGVTHGSETYPKSALEEQFADNIRSFKGIAKSEQNTLFITEMHSNSQLYLNSKPSSREKLNELPIDQVKEITLINEVNNQKRYVVVITKNLDTN